MEVLGSSNSKWSIFLIITVLFAVIALTIGRARAQSSIDPALAFALSSPAKITLGTNTSITGSAGALGNLTVGSRAVVSNDADSLGKLKLRSHATVGGTCASITQPKVPKSASCTITEVGASSSALVPLSDIPASGVTFCPTIGTSPVALDLKRGAAQTLSVLSGTQIINYKSIKLGSSAVWTISGPSDAVVIINDSGIFKLGKKALITTDGVVPVSSVLILVGSTSTAISQPKVTVGAATVTGALFSAGACSIGANATVAGQMYCGGNVKLGKGAVIGGTLLSTSAADAVSCP